MRVAFLTLGCKVNFYETEKMIEQFRARGFSIVEFSEMADIYIVNTCTVTNIADRKSRQMLHRARKRNPKARVVAVGCYVDSGGEALRGDPAIDAAFSNRDKETVAEQVIRTFGLEETGGAPGGSPDFHRGRTRAFVKVQDGCNQFCTYCLIPYVRGRGVLKSTPVEDVLDQVTALAGKGFREVVLTGIHLSSYGVDFYREKDFVRLGGKPLLELLEAVSGVEGIERIRLGSLEPRILTEEFLQGLVKIPKLCPHFHLSLQSGCDAVLRRMNRRYTTAEYGEKVKLLRRYFDNPAITTDVIVGFPGETEEEFTATVEYLDRLRLADIHVFKYSSRSGTRAAEMENQVPAEQKNRRSDALLEKVRMYREDYALQFVGRRERILLEEVRERDGQKYFLGHNERYVMFGIPLEAAGEKGFAENEMVTLDVEREHLW